MQKINDDVTVAGSITAEEIDGVPVGKLRDELQSIAEPSTQCVSELSNRLDMLNGKIDVIIELMSQIIEDKNKQEDIL